MSDLKTDLIEAFENQKKFVSENPAGDPIPKLAEDLSIAIANFMTAQPLQITELKVKGEIEDIKTAKGPKVQVKPTTLLGPYAPIFDFFKNLGPILDPLTLGNYTKLFGAVENGVKAAAAASGPDGGNVDPIKLKKGTGDASSLSMESKLYVELGSKASFDDENLSKDSEVRLPINRMRGLGVSHGKLRVPRK